MVESAGTVTGAAAAEQAGSGAGAGSSRGIPRKERRLISFTRSEKATPGRRAPLSEKRAVTRA